MDFGLSEEQEMLRVATRALLGDALPPARLRATIDSELGFDREVWEAGAEMGWSGIALPEALGGAGQGVVDLMVVAEEHGRALVPGPFISSTLAATAIATLGSPAQQEELVAPLAAGAMIGSWALAGIRGWDLDDLAVTAERDADGIVLQGTASFVQDAGAADVLVVAAGLEDGMAQVVVPTTTPGLVVRPLRTLDITRRFAQVRFDGVRLPSVARLGDDDARPAVVRQLELASVLTCAETVGAAERLLEMTVEYAKDRVQFGRAIGSFQAIKHKLADMAILLERSRVTTYDAAMALDDEAPDAAEAVSIAASQTGDSCSRLASEALQVHGGIGFTWEHDLHLYLRRIKSDETLFGDPSHHREQLCRLITSEVGS